MRITHTRVDSDGEKWTALREFTYDSGLIEQGGHVFPFDTLEWRAAEYDIDPADIETLLDIVLAEPYLTVEDWATGYRLHDAPDVATARRDHIARCARAKLRHRISTRPAVPDPARAANPQEHPLDPIRRSPGIDIEVVAVKKEHVRRFRQAVAEERARPPETGPTRAERVRRELGLDTRLVPAPIEESA